VIATPRAFSLRGNTNCRSASETGGAVEGSSRISTLGSWLIALAISVGCFLPGAQIADDGLHADGGQGRGVLSQSFIGSVSLPLGPLFDGQEGRPNS
jgi:hypothetical protein